MKKSVSLLLALMLATACVLPSFAESTATQFPALGMEITLPENAANMGLNVIAQEDLMNLTYQDEEVFTALLLVERMDNALYEQLMADEAISQSMTAAGMQVLGQQDTYTYIGFAASNYEDVADYFTLVLGVDYSAFSAETKVAIADALPLVEAAAQSLSLIPIVKEEKRVGAFTTTDLDGNEVTESIFSGYDLTVINVWGTFCGPCIGEMPELARWHKELPENVQLIGLVSDVNEGGDVSAAQKILSDTGVEFVNLLSSNSLIPLLSMSQYVPTTYFVDSEGKMVGDPIVGADVNGYKQFVEEYLK